MKDGSERLYREVKLRTQNVRTEPDRHLRRGLLHAHPLPQQHREEDHLWRQLCPVCQCCSRGRCRPLDSFQYQRRLRGWPSLLPEGEPPQERR